MTMAQVPPWILTELNKTEPGERIIAFMIPVRVIRIVQRDERGTTFRVEQLVWMSPNPMQNPNAKGSWTTLSTHGDEKPWVALPQAFQYAAKAQNDLKAKAVKRAQSKMDSVTSAAIRQRIAQGKGI